MLKELDLETPEMVICHHRSASKQLFHRDRTNEYASDVFSIRLENLNISHIMSRNLFADA